MTEYEQFIASKKYSDVQSGFDCDVSLSQHGEYKLKDFQISIVNWALKRGRAAVFADTGLGKTAMQVTWANEVAKHTGKDVLILAPLCVAQQTVQEAARFGIEVNYCRSQSQVKTGITITNYEMLEHFDVDYFVGIVLDESSILKSVTGKTRKQITDLFQMTPYRLSCTATPSPNDYMELGNQAEFLGIMSAVEMLAMFFTHDGGETSKWRLKGHGKVKFWEWMATWAVSIKSPEDLGFDGSEYKLPPLKIHEHVVSSGEILEGQLFPCVAQTLSERRQAKRGSLNERVELAASIANGTDKPVIVWCHLNDEADALEKSIKRAVNVQGADSFEFKEDAIQWFLGEKCVCNERQFRAKLALNSNQEDLCQKKHISKNTTNQIEKNGYQNLLNIKNKTQSIEKNICESMPKTIEKNSKEQENSKTNTTEKEGKNTPNAPKQEKEQDQKQNNGRNQIKQQEKINVSKSTELQLTNTMNCCKNRMEDAQYAGQKILEKSEDGNCTLTTVMQRVLLGDCCASNVIWESENSKTLQNYSEKQHCICGKEKHNQVLISKPSIFGYGLNLQHCDTMIFAGLDDSFESFYQAVRRCWRFGQKNPVNVHIITADTEGAVKANIERKQRQAENMASEMVAYMREFTKQKIVSASNNTEKYSATIQIIIPNWIKSEL